LGRLIRIDQTQGGYLIAKVHQLANRVFAKLLKQHGIEEINPAQGRILFALWQGDGISGQELSERTSLQKTTMSSMLSRLEESGHIRRVPSLRDRREMLIELTDKNRQLRNQYVLVSREMSDLFYAGLSQAERAQFERVLNHILTNLQSADHGTCLSVGKPDEESGRQE